MQQLEIGNVFCCQDLDGNSWHAVVTDKFEEKWAFGHTIYYTFHWEDGEIETVESKILNTHYNVLGVIK